MKSVLNSQEIRRNFATIFCVDKMNMRIEKNEKVVTEARKRDKQINVWPLIRINFKRFNKKEKKKKIKSPWTIRKYRIL